ncbi:MAG: ORF6N domain-containing protein [Opitutaceae bacterium]|nr:ORF6N domain-containing protein [Opitutaceae bacterium]
MSTLQPWLALCQHIHLVRGHRVVLQSDLARLYEAQPQQIATHAQRFPGDLCFTLENPELIWVDDPPAEIKEPVYGFTEHGALALAYALNSPSAVAMSTQLVRAFVAARAPKENGSGRGGRRRPPTS